MSINSENEKDEFDYESELQKMQKIIDGYPGDTLIPELYLIDYLLEYEGSGIESACSSVSLFFGHFYIQKCALDISISDATDQLSQFFDYLVQKGYIGADSCEKAKAEMKKNKAKWTRQERDWLEMDYDEYNEKYWGFSM